MEDKDIFERIHEHLFTTDDLFGIINVGIISDIIMLYKNELENDGWRIWNGIPNCYKNMDYSPLRDSVIVDYKRRAEPDKIYTSCAINLIWAHENRPADIMFYRIHRE